MVRPRIVYWGLGIGFALLVVHAAHSGCDHDEIVYLHGSWLVSQGQKPFRDFMEHHYPTLLYLLAPSANLLEGSPRALLVAARLLNLALLAVLLGVFVSMLRPLLRTPQAAWASLLLLGCFFFDRNSMEVRPDPWMNVLCFIGLWQWVVYLRRHGRLRQAALAGLCFGTAIAFLPKALFFLGLVGLGTALALKGRARWTHAARGGAALLGAALLPVGALALAIWRSGIWTDFLFWCHTFTRFLYLDTHFPGQSALGTLFESFGESPLLWIGGLLGVALAARLAWQRRVDPEVAIAAVVTVGFLAALFRSRWPFSHNLLLVQPLLALLTAVVLDGIASARLRAAVGVFLVLMLVKVYVLCFVYTEAPGSEVVQRRLLAESAPGTPLAVAPPYNPIFRPNAFFFWYNPESFVAAYLDWCRLHGVPPRKVDDDRRAWRDRPPAFVYLPEDEPTWAPFEFAQHRSAYVETDLPGLWKLVPPRADELQLRR
jgi:4-amino-4-deoxy-L-arabinose transferase-like glycosyltransferase